VQLLLSKGICVDARAAAGGFTPLHLACAYDKAEFVRALLDSGADINSVTATGATPALIAAMYGSTECLQLLAKRGADLSIRDRVGHTLLHAAATWARLQCLSLLLGYSKGIVADVDAVSSNESTPLMVCLRQPVQNELRANIVGSYLKRPFDRGDLDACAQLLLDSGATVAPDMLVQLCSGSRRDDSDEADVDTTKVCARAVATYIAALRSSAAVRNDLLAVHTQACSEAQYSSDTVQHGTGSSCSSGSSCNSTAATTTGSMQQNSSITVQLVHAVTGAKPAKLYKLELRTLERLLAVHSSVDQTSSVLLNLPRPPIGWRTTNEQQQQHDVVELKYDGECLLLAVFCSIVYSARAASILRVQELPIESTTRW
jgi:ankyrin repeat protein